MTVELKFENCRLVNGHPMKRTQITDKAGQPVINADGSAKTDCYFGLAIPKTPGTDWKQTDWGKKIVQAAAAGWTNGEYDAAGFSWKIADGDSTIPNKKGKVPASRPGWVGHWILHCSTQFFVKCYHINKYDPMEQIQNPAEIKPGDYCKALLQVKANFPSESPGVYLNPSIFVLERPGEEIVLDSGTTAAEAFGGGTPAQVQHTSVTPPATPNPAAAAAPPVQPAPEFLTPPAAQPEKYMVNGNVYTREQLTAAGWTDAQIATAQKA